MLKGKNIFVSGANQGIGLETVRIVVARGANAYLACRNLESGRQAVSSLGIQPSTCQVVHYDALKPETVEPLKKLFKETPLHFLVNNAAVAEFNWEEEPFQKSLGVNFDGPVFLTQELIPCMAQGGAVVMVSSNLGARSQIPDESYRDAIVNATSIPSLREAIKFKPESSMAAIPWAPAYRVSKCMLNRATELLAVDPLLTSRKITISAVHPGWCRTQLGGRRATSSAEDGALSVVWSLENASIAAGGFFKVDARLDW